MSTSPPRRLILPPPLIVERDQIDDCGHRFPHCRTCRCSDCRPMEWRRWRSGGYMMAERVVRFDG